MKSITIQPYERSNGVLPYPYHIDEKGFVKRQDFWNGKPYRLIGFSKDLVAGQIDLHFSQFWQEPRWCVKMFPVFADKEDNWYTYGEKIGAIKVNKTAA